MYVHCPLSLHYADAKIITEVTLQTVQSTQISKNIQQSKMKESELGRQAVFF
jgi:hypothetical protein